MVEVAASLIYIVGSRAARAMTQEENKDYLGRERRQRKKMRVCKEEE